MAWSTSDLSLLGCTLRKKCEIVLAIGIIDLSTGSAVKFLLTSDYQRWLFTSPSNVARATSQLSVPTASTDMTEFRPW